MKNFDCDDFLAGICVALAVVQSMDYASLWREIVVMVGTDELLQYATFVEPEEWVLAGFGKYARTELGRAKPRTRRRHADVSLIADRETPATTEETK
jgi:hypothetical protein